MNWTVCETKIKLVAETKGGKNIAKVGKKTSKQVYKNRNTIQKSIPIKTYMTTDYLSIMGMVYIFEYSDVNYVGTSDTNKAAVVLGWEQIQKSQKP